MHIYMYTYTIWIIPIAGLRYLNPLVSMAAGTWIYESLSLAALLWLLVLWSLPVTNMHIQADLSSSWSKLLVFPIDNSQTPVFSSS